MKYNKKEFDSAVKYYQTSFSKYKKKAILILLEKNNKQAYYSIAPLSKALHNLDVELNVVGINKKGNHAYKALARVWETYNQLTQKIENKKTIALSEFINEVEKKTKGKFKKIFKKPDLILNTNECFNQEKLCIKFKTKWFKPYRQKDLLETSRVIWSQACNVKWWESVGVGFELIPKQLELPLEDYLDSFSIARAMKDSLKNKVSFGASSSKTSILKPANRVSDLKTTLLGCELEKNIDEPVFQKYKKLSKLLKLNCLKPSDINFFIHGKGYGGKHLFGETIGYPTPNKKTRWPSPGGIIYKFEWYPQSKEESRDPQSRVCFTETLPIDIFIKTSKINWFDMQKRNKSIADVMKKADKIIVKSKKSNFEVFLKGKNIKREAKLSGTETRNKINKTYYKKTGMKVGNMANIPGGEAFLTPEYIKGTFYGDVVISIDQSYMLSEKIPLVVKADKKGYKIISGPKKIIRKLNQEKRNAWRALLEKEKHKSLPQSLINLKKKNFNKLGEFAINTNPEAELCDYLIVNEKIANMIHIALGSGFDPDRTTEYHYDIVINAKKQKMDIYGVKGKQEFWILKKGKFAI